MKLCNEKLLYNEYYYPDAKNMNRILYNIILQKQNIPTKLINWIKQTIIKDSNFENLIPCCVIPNCNTCKINAQLNLIDLGLKKFK